MKHALPAILLLLLCACQPDDPSQPPVPQTGTVESTAETGNGAGLQTGSEQDRAGTGAQEDRLGRILAAQPEQIRARFDGRNPRETLEFFGVEPGMTVVEALPGGGWYTRILLPYLGSNGHLIGANYALELWPNFAFANDEFMAEMRLWRERFPEEAAEWCQSDCADVSAFWLGSLPEDLKGSADLVMFVRALHNLARYQQQGDFLDSALADAFAVLKPGGIFGVVQHEARPDMPDDWADGNNGYLKKRFVIDRVEAAGFELVAESDINANPIDRPGTDEYVWRLPPSLRLPEEDSELLARYQAIGESNRMTLKFRKPLE